MVSIECQTCGKKILTWPSRVGRKKFCSRTCGGKYNADSLAIRNRERGTGNIAVSCSYCGKELARSNYRVGKHKAQYCSRECKKHGQLTHVGRVCATCGDIFYVHPSDIEKSANGGSFCSKKCVSPFISLRQIGANNPFWKGGVSSENKLIRNGKRMTDWRIAVFKRDDYTCQVCGQRGGLLHAHHKIQFHLDRENFDISNGMTVHAKCHYEEIHGFNREQ